MSQSPRATYSPRSEAGYQSQGGGRRSPNGAHEASGSGFGTVLGPGTCGLGPEHATAADNEIDRRIVRDFWSDWDKTRSEWKRLDSDRDAKVIAELSKNSREKLIEASIKRMDDIKAMTAERKKFEAEAKIRREEEAKEQMKINKEHNEEMKLLREEGIARREEAKKRELENIHLEREQMLEMDRMEKEREEQLKRDHIEKLRLWHEHCKVEAAKEKEKRLELAKDAVKEVCVKKQKRKVQVEGWRKDIIASKAALKQNIKTDIEERWAVTKQKMAHASRVNYEEQKASLAAQVLVKERREQEHRLQKQSLVKTLRGRLSENRKIYEEKKALEKEALQASAKAQREQARRERDEEAAERAREHAEFIDNVRELARQQRIEDKRVEESNKVERPVRSTRISGWGKQPPKNM